MFPSCSHCFTGLRTYFVFSVAQLLPMLVNFFGFNGNFNGKMTKIKSTPKTPKMGVFGYFGVTENGTWGAQIKILRPLFNTNTPPKTPI